MALGGEIHRVLIEADQAAVNPAYQCNIPADRRSRHRDAITNTARETNRAIDCTRAELSGDLTAERDSPFGKRSKAVDELRSLVRAKRRHRSRIRPADLLRTAGVQQVDWR